MCSNAAARVPGRSRQPRPDRRASRARPVRPARVAVLEHRYCRPCPLPNSFTGPILSDIPDTMPVCRVLPGMVSRWNGDMTERTIGPDDARTRELGSAALSPGDVAAVAREYATVALDDTAAENLSRARRHVDGLAAATEPTYGVSTGFGALAVRHIPPERRTDLQRSLIRSHAAGAGDPVEPEVVRALMLLRLRTLSTGHTGVRPETAHALAAMLNAGITPV